MNQQRSSKIQMIVSLTILIWASLAFSQEGVPLFTKDFTPEEFAKRRSAVYDAIGAKALAVLQGAPSPEGYMRFRQANEFYSLIASATNAWYPHYNAGKRQMQDGDFLLMDFAPDVGYYMSDVTRMWPVNGKFNAWQRELYDFYLGCYQAILQAIRPGVTAATIKQEASKVMEGILKQAKFSKPHYEKAGREFVESYRNAANNPETSMGHWVGMATHDVGTHTGPLQPGMVFTIEPALRVPEEKIYIRLEDVIVITATGKEILSEFVPMDRAGIEKLMAAPGILETYAPARFTSK